MKTPEVECEITVNQPGALHKRLTARAARRFFMAFFCLILLQRTTLSLATWADPLFLFSSRTKYGATGNDDTSR